MSAPPPHDGGRLARAASAAALLLCAAIAVVAQPGAEALRGAQGWWTARAFEQAAFDSDWLQMGRLGSRLLAETGDARPLQLAAYRFGLDGTARTQGQLDAEIRAWGGLFAEAMHTLEGRSQDPWTDAQVQAFVQVTRLAPLARAAQADPAAAAEAAEAEVAAGLAALERWLAAGAGYPRSNPDVAQEYRRMLDSAPSKKKVQMLRMIDQ